MAKKSSKGKPAASPAPIDDAKGKKGKKNKEETPKDDGKAKQRENRVKVSATVSWTGKLPHTLLHETVQKRKWNKVEYEMKKIGDKGMLAIAILSYTDPKTKEVLSVRMHDPSYDKATGKGLLVPQETPIEARHYAATVALHRIAFNTNMHMMLPPNHKKLWYALEDFRKQLAKADTRQCDRTFSVDPFKVLLDDRIVKESRKREMEIKKQQEDKMRKPPTLVTSIGQSKANQGKINKPVAARRAVSFPKSVWQSAPFIDLEESSRNLIEITLKKHIDWQSRLHGDVEMQSREDLELQLLFFGFRKAHVTEAMQYKDPLSFLIFNLPEDDLPPFFHKRQEDSKVKVELATLPLATRNMISRLMEFGASYDEVLLALEKTEYNEPEAAGLLTRSVTPMTMSPIEFSEEESSNIWRDELESLSSIYTDKIEVIDRDSCYMIDISGKFNLKLKVYKTKQYPGTLPGIIISTFDKNYKLPNYIKQQIIKNLLHHVINSGLVGDMLVFDMFEWLNENLEGIIENPGPLLIFNGVEDKRQKIITSTDSGVNMKKKSNIRKTLNAAQLKQVKADYKARIESAAFGKMLKARSKLPAWNKQESITNMVLKNDVVLITGETGSGKSTQIVQFILDHLIKVEEDYGVKIICTQPRRISAIGLAERVSEERATQCGGEVGYVIRGTNKSTAATRITFMTTGILVRILQGDITFLKNAIVVVDEVHERSVDTDLIVIMLKNLLGKIQGLKIILMSATVNVDVFKAYFKDLQTCHIEGRTFPVEDYYLEDVLEALDFKVKRDRFHQDDMRGDHDSAFIRPNVDSKIFKSGQINYELVVETALHIHQRLLDEENDGSIIIFMPGVAEINRCCDKLEQCKFSKEFMVLPLHSALPPDSQKRVFKRFPGKRKIIVSTNIAETSITIDDCVATVDTGRAKVMHYDPKNHSTALIEAFISKAEANQRRGRAGRVRNGYSYKLYSKDTYTNMANSPLPEIKRIPLENLYLSVKAMGINDVIKFLGTGIDPPPMNSILKAEQMLTTTGLLDESGKSLTELGRYISLMPVMDSKHGKLLIYSIIFGCTDLGVLIASVLSIGMTPFIAPFENRDKIKSILSRYKHKGDILATVEVVRQYLAQREKSARRRYMDENLLSYAKLNEIMSARSQFYSNLEDVGFLPLGYKPGDIPALNKNCDNLNVIKCILTGAFYPQVARVQLPDPRYMATSSGSMEMDADAKATKLWIRNEEYIDLISTADPATSIDANKLPATRAFLHPSSVFFAGSVPREQDLVTLDESTANLMVATKMPALNAPFAIYGTANATSKLFLRDLTLTSVLAVLLFGGPLRYDINGTTHSPGMVVDNWLPIRTWCKNGVLIKELRLLLDQAIKQRLERSPILNTDNPEEEFIRLVLQIVQLE
ncbi:AER094Cp [Eremothecium gossypii ATCC 10895]|uniref:AER094Cp n=1 Tax=Eremothecium gossypii (strain ATCC 10895 / CBS 109.51 / FGSC 9923 / NRRL Y-1056) TaxID=284811 RepID=Q757B9_EREGS|nr:AER094Cp [Eremothecium gossypii ATCC 10895]AAS52778.2 AER094Cp [Eremothecium gossypii ATCC 10895]AEY97084.1 FAER094Cp [Eremothecium gossypii FDAG1]